MRTKTRSPRLDLFLKIQRYAILVAIVIFPALGYTEGILISVFAAIAATITMLVVSSIQSTQGHHSARVFLLSWVPFLLGSLVYAFRVLGFLPANAFTTFAIQYGAGFQMIILSFGIIDRIHRMRQDREQAQTDSIEQLKRSEKQLEKFLFTLAATIESRDHYTGGHVERVAWYSRELALLAGADRERAQKIFLGAIVHDAGKILIPDDILNKKGPLNMDQRELMEKHTTEGKKILDQIGTEAIASNIAYSHHERWDGTGYPERLSENRIPFESRVVAIADFWDAVTTERPYHNALSIADASALLLRLRGQAFDPDLVDLFLQEKPGIFRAFLYEGHAEVPVQGE